MKILRIINVLYIPGAILFITIAIYANYQSIIGYGAVSVSDLVVYLFIYSVISFCIWLGSLLLS